MALITPEELATYLKADDLDLLAAYQSCSRAENYLRVELGVEFTQAARTFTDRIPATRTYQRLEGPLVSVQSVTVAGSVLPATDYELTRTGVTCPNSFGQNADTSWVSLAIAYTGGFATIPGELQDAALHLAGVAYLRGANPGVQSSTITVEGVTQSETYGGDSGAPGDPMGLPEPEIRRLRARYGSGRPVTGSVRVR